MKGFEQFELFEAEELLDINELSHIPSVPKFWIYERTRRGEIPHIKLGKYFRFNMSEIKEWLKTCERGMIK